MSFPKFSLSLFLLLLLFPNISKCEEQNPSWTQKMSFLQPGSVCDMAVVVDNPLFNRWNQSSRLAREKIKKTVDVANKIFEEGGPVMRGGKPLQFQLQEKDVLFADTNYCDLDNPSQFLCPSAAANDTDDSLYILYKFVEAIGVWSIRNKYCLVYLFTGRVFPKGDDKLTLGRAVLAGACARMSQGSNATLLSNAGLVSVGGVGDDANQLGEILAHELAHSLGAEHDAEGDLYLMAPIWNRTFSSATVSEKSLRQMNKNILEISVGLTDRVSLLYYGGKEVSRSWCFREHSYIGYKTVPTNTNTSATTTQTPTLYQAIVYVGIAAVAFVLLSGLVTLVALCYRAFQIHRLVEQLVAHEDMNDLIENKRASPSLLTYLLHGVQN